MVSDADSPLLEWAIDNFFKYIRCTLRARKSRLGAVNCGILFGLLLAEAQRRAGIPGGLVSHRG